MILVENQIGMHSDHDSVPYFNQFVHIFLHLQLLISETRKLTSNVLKPMQPSCATSGQVTHFFACQLCGNSFTTPWGSWEDYLNNLGSERESNFPKDTQVP